MFCAKEPLLITDENRVMQNEKEWKKQAGKSQRIAGTRYSDEIGQIDRVTNEPVRAARDESIRLNREGHHAVRIELRTRPHSQDGSEKHGHCCREISEGHHCWMCKSGDPAHGSEERVGTCVPPS